MTLDWQLFWPEGKVIGADGDLGTSLESGASEALTYFERYGIGDLHYVDSD